MKLSKDEIQFIDNYLVNTQIIYVDIRYEMIDHIAMAVEEKMEIENLDFYDAFKSYMAVNKSELIKTYKKNWFYSWRTLKQFVLFLIQPFMLIFGIALYFVLKQTNIISFFGTNFSFKNFVVICIGSIFIFQLLYFHVYLKKRFYSLEKTGFILVFLYYAQILFLANHNNEPISFLSLVTFTFLIVGYLAYLVKEIIKFNKHRFNYAYNTPIKK